MTDIQFYHLLTTPLERALPKLMEKALSAEMKSVIRAADEEQMHRLNDALWNYAEHSFLPHGASTDPHPEQQPVYITSGDETPNEATVLVITNGKQVDSTDGYDKLLDMFDGHDEESVAAARKRWSYYKEAGHNISYFQQQKGGGWKKQA